MSINKKCPKCGSEKVQLTNENKKHGVLWFILFSIPYACWWLFKATCALCVLILWDWWMAIIKKKQGKGYTWISKRMISNKSQTFYCHECNHNFRA